MSMAFVGAAFLVQPNFADLVTAIFSPHIPSGALITSLAMVGTTVVPYNLFLHASAVREKWPADVPLSQSLPQARVDTLFSVSLGGMVTLAIMMTAAAVFFQKGTQIENAADMAAQLEPLLGPVAKSMFAFGLLAAGLTSAVTAPLAAAYALRGVLGWAGGRETWRFRIVWMSVLLVGTGFAFAGKRPLAAILFAQAANGILLPVTAMFLLFVMNRRDLLGEYVNSRKANVLGGAIVLTTVGLGTIQLLKVFGWD
jgi:Mn2+/Fe2+ NRAMP family transporter